MSPPARGRGLKPPFRLKKDRPPVAPRAGAWIETRSAFFSLAAAASPPARGRGLKHSRTPPKYDCNMSPPARGRGLKPALTGGRPHDLAVAPRAGAWIETFRLAQV